MLAGHSINNHDLAKEVQYLTGTVLPSAAPGVVLAIKSDFGAGVVEALGQIVSAWPRRVTLREGGSPLCTKPSSLVAHRAT